MVFGFNSDFRGAREFVYVGHWEHQVADDEVCGAEYEEGVDCCWRHWRYVGGEEVEG